MKAVVINAVNNICVEEVPYPIPKANEVLIKVFSAGICGTDPHILKGEFPADYPIIAGHEFSGIVQEVGADVTDWKTGDKVAVDPTLNCGKCEACLNGQMNMCLNMKIVGVTTNGGFAEYAAVPARTLYRIPEHVSFDDAAFIEPLSCTIYGMNRLQAKMGDSVLITGAGPMGLLNLKAIKACGASKVVCMDKSEHRLETAKTLGADKVFSSFEDMHEYLHFFDIVIEATGNPRVIEKIFDYAGKRAKILQFGCAAQDAKIHINPFDIYNNDWKYIGSRAINYTFEQALKLISSDVINGNGIINDFINLDQVPNYLRGEMPLRSLKVMVHPWE